MSLLTLPAFLTRRREDNTMPETPVAESSTVQADDDVLMRFLTQGGAQVHVTGSGRYGTKDCHWLCLGCGETDNGIGRYDWDARGQANAHATDCRSMPKPEA